ncbi:MAG: AAA family ATPase [Chloroflexi bacterium]|nr:AAA family ATPase [Chloroflexota bacterium]
MSCAKCQAANPPGARFCTNCGAPLSLACPSCSAPLPPQARFCPQCGHALHSGPASQPPSPTLPSHEPGLHQYIPPELLAKLDYARAHGGMLGERRIVTMLFCDVKGSTAAASTMDPEEWAEVMKGAFECLIAPVYRYEGTLARLMGDAILAFFGAPIAHEDDPQRAVLAGLEVLEGIRPFRETAKRRWGVDFDVRVGINTGLVVVGEVGSDLRLEYTAMGDAVNLAARMEQTAQPGTVQIADNTYRFVAPLFDTQDLGMVEVKGKQEPVHTYRVLRPRSQPGPLRGIEGLRSPLVGRDHEMGMLRGAVAELLQGRGQIISVMGEAGLGKSRLVAELRHALVAEGALREHSDGLDVATVEARHLAWFEGRSLSYQSSMPYTPFVGLLTSFFDLRQRETDAEKCARVMALVAQAVPEGVMEIAPFIATMLGIQLAGEASERVRYLQPPQVRERVIKAVLQYLERVVAARPLVLVFEDLHWADPVSLDLLQQLMPLADRVPLMLIGVFRPWRQEASWRFHEVAARDYPHRYTSLLLEPLTERDSRALVGNLLHIEDLPERVRNLILTKAEGNPFFVEEVIRSLLDAHLVVLENSHWRATREIETIAVPSTLVGVIQSRLDRLDEASRQVVQTASVIGREFSLDALAAISKLNGSMEGALADLQRRELLREKSRLPQRVFIFKHVLTQEAAYASLLMSTRRELHRRTAEYMERTASGSAGEIAQHFLEARDEARALPHLVQAGEHAAFACSLKEALSFFRKAVEILESVRDVSLARRAYEGVGGALALSFDVPGAVDTFHKMIHVADTYDNLPMKVSALNKLGRVTGLMRGQFPEAFEHLREAERLALIAQDLPGLTELHGSYCALRTLSGDIDGALVHQRRAIQIGKRPDAMELGLFGMAHCANSLTYLTHFDEARQQALDALAAAEKAGNRSYMTWPLLMPIPWYHLRLGDLEIARQEVQRGTDLSSQIGAEDCESVGAFILGLIARLQGRYEDAMAWQRRSIGCARASGFLFVEAGALCALGSLYLELSDKDQEQAEEHHSQALNIMDNPFGLVLAAQSWTDMGFWALARGQANHANELFKKTLTGTSTFRYLVRPAALVGAALASAARGDLDDASRLAGEARAFAEERTMRLYYPLIARGEGHVAKARGDTRLALERYADAEGLALEMGMRPMAWQVGADIARLLASSDRQEEAEVVRRKAQGGIQEIAALFQDGALRARFLDHAMGMLAQ